MQRLSRRDLLGRTAGMAVGASFGLPALAAARPVTPAPLFSLSAMVGMMNFG